MAERSELIQRDVEADVSVDQADERVVHQQLDGESMPHGCRLLRPRPRRDLIRSALRAGHRLLLHHGLRLILSIVISFVMISCSIEHPLEQEQKQDEEQRDDLHSAESVQSHGGRRKALLLVFS